MRSDDPRHGSTRGFHAGCRERCCRAAIARYEKQGRVLRQQGRGRKVAALGAQRRLQALMALGWTATDIAHACGWSHRNSVHRIVGGQKGKPCRWVERKTDLTVRRIYDQLAMRPPPRTPHNLRSRSIALSKGWAPPLAWGDAIDDPDTRPDGATAYVPTRAPKRRQNRPKAEQIAEAEHLIGLGESFEQAARALGIAVESLEKAYERAKREAA